MTVRPLADGGEGTVEALISGMGGTLESVTVTGPLGDPVVCTYGILPHSDTAVLEMSGAAGLPLVPEDRRNPLLTTTYGVGEVIRHAIEKGCRRFLVGIGGSATNDGGVGMLQALGFGFWDDLGHPIGPGAQGLSRLARITCDQVLPALSSCEFRVACDVTNPLCGPQGCSAVYGPQKGASPEMIREMDPWLAHYAHLAQQLFPDSADPTYPGSGAAGGMGFAFLAFTRGVLEPGVQIILEETGLEQYIRSADLVVTGEGRLDGQTSMGKAPVGVARLAKQFHKPVVANISGFSVEDYAYCCEKIDAQEQVGIIEVNISCPNVKHGGMSFGTVPESAYEVTRAVKAVTSKPVYMKLSPNVTDIVAIARACEEGGADGLTLINTLLGMRIDLRTRRPVIANTMGGFSGPAIFPVALRMVYQVAKACRIPVMGCGGVATARDVIEMMMAGATAVQVGAENLRNPYACKEIIEALPAEMERLGIARLRDIVGVA